MSATIAATATIPGSMATTYAEHNPILDAAIRDAQRFEKRLPPALQSQLRTVIQLAKAGDTAKAADAVEQLSFELLERHQAGEVDMDTLLAFGNLGLQRRFIGPPGGFNETIRAAEQFLEQQGVQYLEESTIGDVLITLRNEMRSRSAAQILATATGLRGLPLTLAGVRGALSILQRRGFVEEASPDDWFVTFAGQREADRLDTPGNGLPHRPTGHPAAGSPG